MATSTGTKIFAAGLVSLVVLGCEGLLGGFEVAPDLPLTLEAGSDAPALPSEASGPVTPDDGGQEGAAPTPTRTCESAFDCPAVLIEPAGCGIIRCIDKKCRGVAMDRDNDGHAVAGCKVDGQLVQGYANDKDIPADDCADDLQTVFPGGECTKTPEGANITFPTGSPVGICKRGAWACESGKAVCRGAVGPLPAEDCSLKNDSNCNGTADDGCECDPGTTGPCGNAGNLPTPCKKGTRTCVAGKWGACTGNVEPKARDCSTTVDNDCNGTVDKSETQCRCGVTNPGSTASCSVPNGVGACATGSRTCQLTADKQSAVFGPCVAPIPGRPNCSSASDVDCDGVPDELQVACGSPCVNEAGSQVPAAQITAGMFGCKGTFRFPSAYAGCVKGVANTCSIDQWVKYLRGAPAPKPPTHKYWVAEKLSYGGTVPNACFAAAGIAGMYDCGGGEESMTVCPAGTGPYGGVTDAEGNVCNWTDCSYGTGYSANDYLGGCSGNLTGGTLCCQ